MEQLPTLSEEFEQELDFPFEEEPLSDLAFEFTPEKTKELSRNELHDMGIELFPPAKISIRDMQKIGAIPEQFKLNMEKIQDLTIDRLGEFDFILGIITKGGKVRDVDFSKQEPLNMRFIQDLLLE